MLYRRLLAGSLAALQAAFSFSWGATEAVAQVVTQSYAQPSPVNGVSPVVVNAPIVYGGAQQGLGGVSLSGVLPGAAPGRLAPVALDGSVLSVPSPAVWTASDSQAPAMPAGQAASPVVAAPLRPSGLGRPVQAPVVAGPAAVAAEVREKAALVGEVLAAPGLSRDAAFEASSRTGEHVFAALRRERLVGAPDAGLGGPSVAGRTLTGRSGALRVGLAPAAPVSNEGARAQVPQPGGAAELSNAARQAPWYRAPLRWAGAVVGAAGIASAVPFLAPYAGAVAAAGSVVLSIIGIPQIIHNFKAGKEGAKDLAVASPLIWLAASVLLSVVSIGQGASLAWNAANLAGVLESAIVVGQLNWYKRDAKALKATLATVAAVAAPLPFIAAAAFMPLSAWVGVSFAAAMGLLWVLNWPQIRQNYKLFQAEGRPPKGIAPLYPGLVVLGSLMHLFAAVMGGDMRWAMNAAIAILTAGMVLGQLYFPKAANAIVGPLVRLTDRILPDKTARLGRQAKDLVDPIFEGADLRSLEGNDGQEAMAGILDRAKAMPGRSVIFLEAPTAAGKSTLAAGLRQVLGGRIKVFPVDRYFKPGSEVPKSADGLPDFDRPEALDLERVARDIRTLLAGGRVELPLHDMAAETTRFDSGEFLALGQDEVLVVDSIYASHGRILRAAEGHPSLNVYLDAPAIVRLARRLRRDQAERGIPLDRNLRQWGNILADEAEFILPLKSRADVVVNLVTASELAGLREAYARLLAGEWASRGKDEAATRMFLERLKASLEADGLRTGGASR